MVYYKIVHNVSFNCPDHHHACSVCKQCYQDDQMHLMYNGRIFSLVDNKCLKKIEFIDSTSHFDLLFIEKKLTLDSTSSLADSVQQYTDDIFKETMQKKMCYMYYLYNDLVTMKTLCNIVSCVLPKVRKTIENFKSRYTNENTKLLSNYSTKEINKIIKIDPNLGTQEKIYLWLCKKCM